MRILLIARGCRPGNGIPWYTHQLALQLARRHDITVLSDPRACEPGPYRIRPVRAPDAPRWLSLLWFSLAAGETARRLPHDVVHTQGSDGSWGDVVTAHSCHWAGMQVSLALDPSPANRRRKTFSPAHRAVVGMERRAFFSARRLVPVSDRVRRELHAFYPQTRSIPCPIVHPGVSAARFAPAVLAEERSRMRAELGVPAHTVLFLLAATDLRLKGADRLLAALAVAGEPRASVLLASNRDPRRTWTGRVRRLELAGRVHYLTLSRDIRPALAAADVCAGFPEYESFGLTYLEALAAGRPLLLTANAGVAELLRDGREGVLLPAGAGTEEAARGMAVLTRDADLRGAMARSGRLTAEQYSWERTAAACEQLYVEVAREKRRAA